MVWGMTAAPCMKRMRAARALDIDCIRIANNANEAARDVW